MVISHVQALTAKTRPKKVVCNMIYHPSETASGGWADLALGALMYRGASGFDEQLAQAWPPLGYRGYVLCWPSMLQLVIRTLSCTVASNASWRARASQVGRSPASTSLPSRYSRCSTARIPPTTTSASSRASRAAKRWHVPSSSCWATKSMVVAAMAEAAVPVVARTVPRNRRGVHERSVYELSNASHC